MLGVKEALKKLEDYYFASGAARKRLADVLLNNRPFKELLLNPPTEKTIRNEMSACMAFVQDWMKFPHQEALVTKSVKFRFSEKETQLPERLAIPSIATFRKLLSNGNRNAFDAFLSHTKELSGSFSEVKAGDFYPLINELWDLDDDTVHSLSCVLPQLRRNMGQNRLYIRALPVSGIDTKFIESNSKLILLLLQTAIPQEFSTNADEEVTLESWLGVKEKPSGFVYLRIPGSKFNVMQVTAKELSLQEIPGKKLVVVENLQSGYMLPDLPETAIVFGCGRNLIWADGIWLKNKSEIWYWGDLDSWGFGMLRDFRKWCPAPVKSLMMEPETIMMHPHAMVQELESLELDEDDPLFTLTEKKAIHILSAGKLNRLEQEKLSQNYVLEQLKKAELL